MFVTTSQICERLCVSVFTPAGTTVLDLVCGDFFIYCSGQIQTDVFFFPSQSILSLPATILQVTTSDMQTSLNKAHLSQPWETRTTLWDQLPQ